MALWLPSTKRSHARLTRPQYSRSDALILRRRLHSAHQQHWRRRRSDDVLRVAPHDETTNTPTSMGTEHNQVGWPLFRIVGDHSTDRSHRRLDGFGLRFDTLFARKARCVPQDGLTTLTQVL